MPETFICILFSIVNLQVNVLPTKFTKQCLLIRTTKLPKRMVLHLSQKNVTIGFACYKCRPLRIIVPRTETNGAECFTFFYTNTLHYTSTELCTIHLLSYKKLFPTSLLELTQLLRLVTLSDFPNGPTMSILWLPA